jgi:hypothetical protein
MSYQQRGHTARPAVAKSNSGAAAGQGAKSGSNLIKLTALFADERREGAFDVKVTPEMIDQLNQVATGGYLKAYVNVSEKSGKQYLTLAFKPSTRVAE